MANLFMTVEDALTPSLRGLVAVALDEPAEGIARGIRCLTGGVVAGLIGDIPSPVTLRAVRDADLGLLIDASALLEGSWDRGSELPGLLGAKAQPLASACAATAGIKPASAHALLNLVEPLVLAAIARSGVASDEAGLRSYLRSLEAEATRLAPPAVAAPAPAPTASATPPTRSPRDRATLWRLGFALALVALAIVLLVVLARR